MVHDKASKRDTRLMVGSVCRSGLGILEWCSVNI